MSVRPGSDASEQPPDLQHRALVLRLAYDVCGSWADAEDVAQTVHLRWLTASGVQDPRAYLARMAVHAALDVVARREYGGAELPGAFPTAAAADAGVVDAAEVELAVGVLLQSLSALERAAFLLHDVFGFTFEEVATMLGRSPAAVRQLGHRARSHIRGGRPRFDVSAREVTDLAARFLAAARDGDLAALLEVLAPDVELIADGGGRRSAALRPVRGSDAVARFVRGLAKKHLGGLTVRSIRFNGTPAWLLEDQAGGREVMWLEVREGRIARVYSLRDPRKLLALEAPAAGSSSAG